MASMLSIEANPSLDRQASVDRAVLLWRDREDGGRQGLLVAVGGCGFPTCCDRHVDLEAYWVDDTVALIEEDLDGLWVVARDGSSDQLFADFQGSFDVDRGAIDKLDRGSDPAAIAWIHRELEGELAAYLRREYERALATGEARPRTPAQRSRPRVGRNEPCPCGSGRKYKRCCLGAAS